MNVDMHPDKLREYMGRNECPADIDQYWDESVAEMEALGTGCELIPAKFQAPGAECYDLWFTGVGGCRVHAKFLRPAKLSIPAPAVLHFHGYTSASADFSTYLNYVCSGFAVAALDCRGQGGLSDDTGTDAAGSTMNGFIVRGLSDPDPKKLKFRHVFLDAAQLARIVMSMPDVDETRVGATGGSQGGGLTLACAALTPDLNRIAPQIPFLCDYRRVWEMDLDVAAYEELKYFFRKFDPRHEREEEIFTKLGYIDNINLAHRIKSRVMMFTGLMDTVCPPSTQFACYNRITAPKQHVIYPDYAHESFPDGSDMVFRFMCEM